MNQIAHIRLQVLKIPQWKLAEITNTTQATVSRWETGELHPDRQQMDAIRHTAFERGIEWDDRWFFEIPNQVA